MDLQTSVALVCRLSNKFFQPDSLVQQLSCTNALFGIYFPRISDRCKSVFLSDVLGSTQFSPDLSSKSIRFHTRVIYHRIRDASIQRFLSCLYSMCGDQPFSSWGCTQYSMGDMLQHRPRETVACNCLITPAYSIHFWTRFSAVVAGDYRQSHAS